MKVLRRTKKISLAVRVGVSTESRGIINKKAKNDKLQDDIEKQIK